MITLSSKSAPNSTVHQNFNENHFRSVLYEWYDDSIAFWLHRDGNISMIFIKILRIRVSFEILGYNNFVIWRRYGLLASMCMIV